MARAVMIAGAVAIVLPLTAFQDSTVHKIGEKGITPPRVIEKIDPQYTEEAKNKRIEGTTGLQVVIDESGAARDIVVVRSLDAGLDAQAIAAVSHWKFAPGRKDGNPVRVQAMIEVNFRLQ
jgi:TonB family protein